MPWVGLIAPDWPSGIDPPTVAVTAEHSANGGGGVSVTINTPLGITLGDLMLFSFIATPDFVGFSSRSIPGSITLLTDPTVGSGAPLITGYKYADANDVAGTSSYTFSASNPGGLADGRATMVSFPAAYGTLPSSAQVDTSTTPSITPTAGADWYFVCGQVGQSGISPQPVFTLTSAGNLLQSSTAGSAALSTRNYSVSKSVSPIAGSYGGTSAFYRAMAVIGISL